MENNFEWTDELVREFALIVKVNGTSDWVTNQLKDFKQSKQRKPLLVVEGKELFEGDGVWCISFNNEIIYHQVNEFSRDLTDETCTFLTEEAAKKWLNENKKTISYKDLENYCAKQAFFHFTQRILSEEGLLNHFKPKL